MLDGFYIGDGHVSNGAFLEFSVFVDFRTLFEKLFSIHSFLEHDRNKKGKKSSPAPVPVPVPVPVVPNIPVPEAARNITPSVATPQQQGSSTTFGYSHEFSILIDTSSSPNAFDSNEMGEKTNHKISKTTFFLIFAN